MAAVNFQMQQILPATKFLKVAWTETNAETFVQLGLQIKTDNNRHNFLRTRVEQVQSDTDPTDIRTDYTVSIDGFAIANFLNSQNKSAKWLLSCGEESDISCGIETYIMLDTSLWSSDKRKVTTLSNSAATLLTWEDMSTLNNLFAVYFNTLGGSEVDRYNNIFPNTLVPEPEDPVRPLFIFTGWFTENTYQNQFNFQTDTITQNTVLYARWDLDEAFIDLATTNSDGIVRLSDSQVLNDLQVNNKVITESNAKSIIEDLLNDINETLDEI